MTDHIIDKVHKDYNRLLRLWRESAFGARVTHNGQTYLVIMDNDMPKFVSEGKSPEDHAKSVSWHGN